MNIHSNDDKNYIEGIYLPVEIDPRILEKVDVHGSVLVKPTPAAHPGVFLAAANRINVSEKCMLWQHSLLDLFTDTVYLRWVRG